MDSKWLFSSPAVYGSRPNRLPSLLKFIAPAMRALTVVISLYDGSESLFSFSLAFLAFLRAALIPSLS